MRLFKNISHKMVQYMNLKYPILIKYDKNYINVDKLFVLYKK